MFDQHVQSTGFLSDPPSHDSNDDHTDDDESGPDVDLASGSPDALERNLRQDDYQQIMLRAHPATTNPSLLGFRELDVAHHWPTSWLGIPFDRLLSWLSSTKDSFPLPPPPLAPFSLDSLSGKQRLAYDIVADHLFGELHNTQLLMVVLGTAGTGKSFLINAIRHMFTLHSQSDRVRITAPTGIAAANISGSTIHSLLSLLKENLTGARLNFLQTSLAHVRLIVIDEYSFLSIPLFATLDRQLRKIFPAKADKPFAGMNILLCGDPAQLAPVHGQPVYARQANGTPQPTCFHLFRTVVELDQPFRQTGTDATQVRFRELLGRVANCDAQADDWTWLQTRRPSSLTSADNASFDTHKHIVATNNVRSDLNKRKLAKLSPIMVVAPSDDSARTIDPNEYNDDDSTTDDGPQLYAIGAEVMLTANLWTEAGLVNGSCGVVDDILKPDDDRTARVVMVNFPGYRGPSLSPSRPNVIPITQIRATNRNGLPLTLAWAITIHKSQGMTLDRVTVDLGRSEFASGLTFVALSRAKTFNGLRVEPFDFSRFQRIQHGRHVDARRDEFDRLRRLAHSNAQHDPADSSLPSTSSQRALPL